MKRYCSRLVGWIIVLSNLAWLASGGISIHGDYPGDTYTLREFAKKNSTLFPAPDSPSGYIPCLEIPFEANSCTPTHPYPNPDVSLEASSCWIIRNYWKKRCDYLSRGIWIKNYATAQTANYFVFLDQDAVHHFADWRYLFEDVKFNTIHAGVLLNGTSKFEQLLDNSSNSDPGSVNPGSQGIVVSISMDANPWDDVMQLWFPVVYGVVFAFQCLVGVVLVGLVAACLYFRQHTLWFLASVSLFAASVALQLCRSVILCLDDGVFTSEGRIENLQMAALLILTGAVLVGYTGSMVLHKKKYADIFRAASPKAAGYLAVLLLGILDTSLHGKDVVFEQVVRFIFYLFFYALLWYTICFSGGGGGGKGGVSMRARIGYAISTVVLSLLGFACSMIVVLYLVQSTVAYTVILCLMEFSWIGYEITFIVWVIHIYGAVFVPLEEKKNSVRLPPSGKVKAF